MSDRYSITFRVGGGGPHDSLIEKLGLQPKYRRHLGGETFNRKSEHIGTFDRNFTSFDLPEAVIVESDFHKTLSNFLERIELVAMELSSLVEEGARADLYVVLFGKSGGGETFPVGVLARMASLHLELVVTYVIEPAAPSGRLVNGAAVEHLVPETDSFVTPKEDG